MENQWSSNYTCPYFASNCLLHFYSFHTVTVLNSIIKRHHGHDSKICPPTINCSRGASTYEIKMLDQLGYLNWMCFPYISLKWLVRSANSRYTAEIWWWWQKEYLSHSWWWLEHTTENIELETTGSYQRWNLFQKESISTWYKPQTKSTKPQILYKEY